MLGFRVSFDNGLFTWLGNWYKTRTLINQIVRSIPTANKRSVYYLLQSKGPICWGHVTFGYVIYWLVPVCLSPSRPRWLRFDALISRTAGVHKLYHTYLRAKWRSYVKWHVSSTGIRYLSQSVDRARRSLITLLDDIDWQLIDIELLIYCISLFQRNSWNWILESWNISIYLWVVYCRWKWQLINELISTVLLLRLHCAIN